MRNLKANPCQFLTIKLEVKGKVRKSGVVVASQGSPSSVVDNVRFRLDNLGPQPGSRKKAKRKGRGISAGQGNSCGFGMRGQKSRSGPGVMKGFEGGQMPLYRRIPKLRGIAEVMNGCSGSMIASYCAVLCVGFFSYILTSMRRAQSCPLKFLTHCFV